jgi:sugar/nucleoside kinase (ribokinase family)
MRPEANVTQAPSSSDSGRGRGAPAAEPDASRVSGRVHVVGPVCFDLVFSGLSAAPRPGTEVRANYLGISPGGVANVAVALARLGLDVALSAVFADDAFGHYLWSALADEGVDLSCSVQVKDWNTPVTSSVAIDREREMVTYEEVPPVAVESLVPDEYRADAFVVSLADADPAWLAQLHRHAPLVFADVAWDDDRLSSAGLLAGLAAVDVFLPNAAEALACTRSHSLDQAAATLAQGGPLVVVKDGGSGSMAMAPGGGSAVRAAAVPVDALDTTGAGDVFDAGFVYGSLAGWPLAQRLLFANLCASESVKLIGGSLAAPCWRDLTAFWRKLDDAELRAELSFMDAVIHNAPNRRRECRRSFPALERWDRESHVAGAT